MTYAIARLFLDATALPTLFYYLPSIYSRACGFMPFRYRLLMPTPRSRKAADGVPSRYASGLRSPVTTTVDAADSR